ncbi:zinc-dependent alcohol dehydrogenase [Pseudoroseicyclus tamaricis]|uniref:Alcohol dehydrogenase catalytic domain-containing protein n=1 Tax=Pseudoroseicyclus tamaricis TaxID=2705421 RepID=A0A6B2JGF0_9RHOB|nr:alcohol dehydrogenase catalytic domain-containing protein [Pseudoroseicyclus tamaricis]NDV00261.1 alcohol dehydrogenase catalytic domain-containing protein [Pseudoroseicyclus tamaricis]
MRHVVISAPGRIDVLPAPPPLPGPGDLLLAPLAIGLCRTDAELADCSHIYLRDGRASLPMTPGHEWVARVVAVGEEARGFAPGDRVVGECSIGCGHCLRCDAGDYHQCDARAETGIMKQEGALAGLVRFPATSAYKVPGEIADDDAVFAEPAAVALRAVLRAGWNKGDRVLVVGAGTIGWLAAAIAMDLYACEVAVMEPDEARMARAAGIGARPAELAEQFDVVIEASGNANGLRAALGRLASNGRLVAVSLTGCSSHPVDVDRMVVSDQSLTGSLGSPGVWSQMLQLLGRGRVRPAALITGRYPLAGAREAYAALLANAPGTGKLVIVPGDEDRNEDRGETATHADAAMEEEGVR